jgi:hypothetical protein
MLEARTVFLNQSVDLESLIFVLVDQTDAMLDEFSAGDVQALVKLDRTLSRYTSKGILVAIVVARNLEYGLARMWETLIEGSSWETMIFRSRQKAEDWIRQRAAEKFEEQVDRLPHTESDL